MATPQKTLQPVIHEEPAGKGTTHKDSSDQSSNHQESISEMLIHDEPANEGTNHEDSSNQRSNHEDSISEVSTDSDEMARANRIFERPPSFSGLMSEDAIEWVDRYDKIGDYNVWTCYVLCISKDLRRKGLKPSHLEQRLGWM